jgi:general secretion pathway protein K
VIAGHAGGGRGEGGFALLAVLLAGGFLALLVATMSRAAHTEGAVSRNSALAAEARAAADGAVRSTIFDLLADARGTLPRDGSVQHLAVEGIDVSVAVQDAAGLVDLNTAPPELLRPLLVLQSQSPSLAAALLTEILLRRPPATPPVLNGVPSAVPNGLRPVGNPFRSVAELASLTGMPPELYHRLAGLVTVASRQKGIDPRTAPAEILYALPGIDPQRVAQAVAMRTVSPDAPKQLLGSAAQFFADGGHDAVVITAVATVSGIAAERQAIVRLATGQTPPYRIVDWQAGTS